MNQTMLSTRALSPLAASRSIWDPDDSEWGEVDFANKVVETFKATYKTPAPFDRRHKAEETRNANALSRLGNTIQQTINSILPLSPTKKDAVGNVSLSDGEEAEAENTREEQMDMLENTYYCNPSGDVADEVMERVFLGSRYFPAAQVAVASPRHMHIINLEAYFTTTDTLLQLAKPRLCDAVATILSHTSRQCLGAFLDPTVKEFAYRRELDRNKAGLTLIIRRKGNEVFAGAYRNYGFTLQWTLYVKSLVGITGQWHEVYATLKPGLTPIVNGVPQWDKFEPDGVEPEKEEQHNEGSPRKLELSSPKKTAGQDDLSPTDPKFMLYQSRLLANYLLWDIWARFDRMFECKATWEADGVETDVRLRRALVGFGDMDEEAD